MPACSDPMIVPLAMSSAPYKLEVPPGTMTADVAVSYRLDRTPAQLEGFVNDMLITKLPPISNRIRELRRETAARLVAESSTKQAFANTKVEIKRLAAQLDKGQALGPAMDDHRPIHLGERYVAQLLG